MAKQKKQRKILIDADRWKEPWFQNLSPELKCLWDFIWDNSDKAGVWAPAIMVANGFICGSGGAGVEESATSIFSKFNKDSNGSPRIVALEGEPARWWQTEYIEFQYGALSPNSPPHRAILELCKEHGLPEADIPIRPVEEKQLSESNLALYQWGCEKLKEAGHRLPKAKVTQSHWQDSLRLMLDTDKIDEKDIRAVWYWVSQDVADGPKWHGWRVVIKSWPAFRKHYDELKSRMDAENRKIKVEYTDINPVPAPFVPKPMPTAEEIRGNLANGSD